MSRILDIRKPHQRFFEEISRIPRMSFREQAVSDYIVSFAKERGLWYDQDRIGNVIIKKPGTPGYENAAPVMLQAHLDMVCEKEPELSFDFYTEPIRLIAEEGWVSAQGTTLGADDGAGVSLILAVLNDRALEHPPLECVFTVQEEDGMGGALQLDYSKLTAKRLIALDGLEEGTTIISTTGINCGYIIKECILLPVSDPVYTLKIDGLRGGHAALNIGKGQGNAIKIAAELLCGLCGEPALKLISLAGGAILNGIPRECEANFAYSGGFEALSAAVRQKSAEIRSRLNENDPDLTVAVGPWQLPPYSKSLNESDTENILCLINSLPVGVKDWSGTVQDFPAASWNLGNVSTEGGTVRIGYASRSISSEQVAEMTERTIAIANWNRAAYQEMFRYSGYTIEEKTPLIRVWADVYQEETGKALELRRIHSGTDAGTISEKMGGMDIIVLMPDTENVHTPKERMELASFDRTCRYLFKILERCCSIDLIL